MKRYLIFIFGGGLGLVLTLLITTVLTEILSMWYALSYAIGLAIGTSFKFMFHRRITFGNLSQWRTRFRRYVTVIISLNGLNWLLVFAGTEILANIFQEEVKAIYYTSTIIFVTAFMSIANFLINKKWVFA